MQPSSHRARGSSRLLAVVASAGLLLAGGPVAQASQFPQVTRVARVTQVITRLAQAGPAHGVVVRADSVTDRRRALAQQIDDLRETLEGTSKGLVDAAVNLRRAQSQLVD